MLFSSRVSPASKSGLAVLAIAAASMLPCGCTPEPAMKAAPPAANKAAEEHAGHDHPAAGPHKGPLIELGNEEYHAEFVHDEASHRVTIYVLDSGAKKSVPIAAKEITLNLKADGKAKQYKLTAKPQADDGDGKSSSFESDDENLTKEIEAEGADARISLEIDGTPYAGNVPHEHHHH